MLRILSVVLAACLASSCLGIVTAPIKAAADVTGDVARAALPGGDDEGEKRN